MWEEKELKDCTLCDLNSIEGEIHFLFHCPIFSSFRDDSFKILYNRTPNFREITINRVNLTEELMNSSDYFIITLLIKFISLCFDLQNNLLSVLFILKDLILFSSFFYCNFFLIAFVNFHYKMHAFAIL